jgi:siderophore synthetase component
VSLFTRFGIAVEPHLQNVYVAFEGNWPASILLRDLDHSILDPETVGPFIAAQHWRLFLHTWDYMPDLAVGAGRLVHDLFHAHLGEAMLFLRRAVTPQRLWDMAIRILEEQRPQDKKALERFALLHAALPRVRALLRMRLEGTEESRFI